MTYRQLERKINTAGAWFVGSFMGEFLHDYEKWHYEEGGKTDYIKYIHREYGCNIDYSEDSTKTKCYALMSIIENNKVRDALDFILKCNDKKIGEGAKENAMSLIEKINHGEVAIP